MKVIDINQYRKNVDKVIKSTFNKKKRSHAFLLKEAFDALKKISK
jgi:hypothetical protein